MIQEIQAYKNILEGIKQMLNESPYKKGFIIEKVGIPAPTFYRKLKTLSFSPDEMLAIAKLLNPREALLMDIRASEKEYEAGGVVDHLEVIRKLRKDFGF